jgi:plastocyanin
MRRLLPATLSVVALAVVGLPGCGGGDDDNGSSEPATTAPAAGGGGSAGGASKSGSLSLTADKSALKYDKDALSASAGKVTIKFTNPAQIPHNVAVEGNVIEKKTPVIQGGKTENLSLNLKAGKYEFYCSVDGHKQAGMEGTLTVK